MHKKCEWCQWPAFGEDTLSEKDYLNLKEFLFYFKYMKKLLCIKYIELLATQGVLRHLNAIKEIMLKMLIFFRSSKQMYSHGNKLGHSIKYLVPYK